MKLISETRVWFALLEVLASAGTIALASTMKEERGVEGMLAGIERKEAWGEFVKIARHVIYYTQPPEKAYILCYLIKCRASHVGHTGHALKKFTRPAESELKLS